MKIDLDLILKLEDLSKLRLTHDEREIIRGDLEEILGMVAKLEEIDLSDTEPLRHMSEVYNHTRKDVAQPGLPKEKALELGPDADENYFKVPKVLKK